jgi:hypothetical protein
LECDNVSVWTEIVGAVSELNPKPPPFVSLESTTEFTPGEHPPFNSHLVRSADVAVVVVPEEPAFERIVDEQPVSLCGFGLSCRLLISAVAMSRSFGASTLTSASCAP